MSPASPARHFFQTFSKVRANPAGLKMWQNVPGMGDLVEIGGEMNASPVQVSHRGGAIRHDGERTAQAGDKLRLGDLDRRGDHESTEPRIEERKGMQL